VLSVVLASVESRRSIECAVRALTATCRSLKTEIIVVDASRDCSAEIVCRTDPDATVLTRPPGTITPDLWGDGIRASSGQWVILTTGHCVVPEGWAPALVKALSGGAAAAGAGLKPTEEAGIVDLAVFFLRYHAFVGITEGGIRTTREIPGDNAAYRGDQIRAYLESRGRGFFEVEYHRTLRETGGDVVAVPVAAAEFGHSFPLGTILRHRFAHGRQFGAWRTRQGGESSIGLALKAPLVPAVLLARARRNVLGNPELRRGLRRAGLPFLLLASAWAVGEAVGAILGPVPANLT